MATRTYAFGALAPVDRDQREWVIAELRRATRYKNSLVASHRAERERVAIAKRDPQLGTPESTWIANTRTQYRAARKLLRAASDLGWGTYQLVEQDIDAALRSGGELSFHRYDGSGRVGAAIQSCTKARVSIAKACSIAAPDARGRTVARLTMRRGVVVDLPIVLHRAIPAGPLVRAYIQIERVGTRYVWGLRCVVKLDVAPHVRCGVGRCAINFGWRVMGDGVRVAYALGEDGEVNGLVLPLRLLEANRHAESLRAIADREAVAYLGDARSRRRMRANALRLPAPPVPDTRCAPWANSRHWALQDRHLYEWECDERAKAVRQRRTIVLAWAQRLAAQYADVLIETYSMAMLIRHDRPVEIPESRHVRFLVAPGELRAMVVREFGKDRVTKSRGEMTAPHACADGGTGRLVGDLARELSLVCERCGAEKDQDANNAANQMLTAAE